MIRRLGDRLILIGVAHILPKSKTEVEKLILEEEPEIVGVELCYRRYISLVSDRKPEDGGTIKLSRTAILAGFLKIIQDKIGEETGMLPGEEMLSAIKSAKEMDAKVELIDRNINLTLQRLLDRTSILDKLKILFSVLFSFFKLGDELKLEDLTEEKLVKELVSSFRDFSEPMYEVLIEERDHYMADRIFDLIQKSSGKIVCVVGAGHVPGLANELESRLRKEQL